MSADPSSPVIRVGSLVMHPEQPGWGPGRILAMRGTQVTVYFRDIRHERVDQAIRTLDQRYVQLQLAAVQSDPFLDNLPPYADGAFRHNPDKRVTLAEGIESFHARFPLYFDDPAYLTAPDTQERAYKWAAHERFVGSLGNGQLRSLLDEGAIGEARTRILAVEGPTNMLAVFEKAAFRDALQDDVAASRYFKALAAVLEAPAPEPASFSAFLRSVEDLPAETGKTSPAKWTIATIMPFLAQPHRFMFLKPEVTKECAARLMFDLGYTTQLSWPTYSRLLTMSHHLLDELSRFGARDYIDVQSFIWVIGSGHAR